MGRFWEFLRSRYGRALVLAALCAAPPAVEAGFIRRAGLTASVNLSPQASALWPYDTFLDLRWVQVYHQSWIGFVTESAAAIVLRGLFCTVLISIAWPASRPRPSVARLAARNIWFAALIGAVLSPWAALSVVVADVSLAWYLFGEIIPLLLLAPFLQRGGIVPGWWRGLPPAGTVVLSLVNFLTLSASSALVSRVPEGWKIATVAVAGSINGLLWQRAARIALAPANRAPRLRRVPVTPIAFAVVMVLIFTVGIIAEGGVEPSQTGEPSALTEAEARIMKQPVIYLAGYNSQYSGEPDGFTPPVVRFSYAGLGPDGRPKPYGPLDTHQSLVTSASRLAEQIERLRARTGNHVTLVAQSEGAFITRYYLTTMSHSAVNLVAMTSPPLRSGRIYYPPRRAHTGWGIATGWELRGIFSTLGTASRLPNSADEPFIRSFMDNAPLFRGKQVICPVAGVSIIAFEPALDAIASPPGLHADIPVVQVAAIHGQILNNPTARRQLVEFVNTGRITQHRRWDYSILQYVGAAWQTPALKVQLNPVWKTVGGRSTRHYKADRCL